MKTPTQTTCPSVQAHVPGAEVFAVVAGTVDAPDVQYLDRTIPVTREVLEMSAPFDPAEVFRISGPCAMSTACAHFDDARAKCRLAIRTVRMAPVVVHKPPRCAIRGTCMWWHQEGLPACLRCPQVVTNDAAPSERVYATADPTNLAGAA